MARLSATPQLHVFIRDAKPQTHHHFAITVEDLEPVFRRAEAMDALDGRSHGHHIIELPGDVAQTYVRDPAGNLMEIDTPGASRLPEALRREMRWLGDMFPQSEANLRARLFVHPKRLHCSPLHIRLALKRRVRGSAGVSSRCTSPGLCTRTRVPALGPTCGHEP